MNFDSSNGRINLTKDNVKFVDIGTILVARDNKFGCNAFYKVHSFTLNGAPRIQRLKSTRICIYSQPDMEEFLEQPTNELSDVSVNCLRVKKNGRFSLKSEFYFFNPSYQYMHSINYG